MSVLSCEAVNSNLTEAATTSITLDLNRTCHFASLVSRFSHDSLGGAREAGVSSVLSRVASHDPRVVQPPDAIDASLLGQTIDFSDKSVSQNNLSKVSLSFSRRRSHEQSVSQMRFSRKSRTRS